MAKRIAFANQKGGVGKSTICTQTAFFLSERYNKRVLVIDFDAQGNSTQTIMQNREITGTLSHELLEPNLTKIELMDTPYENIKMIGTPRNSAASYEAETCDLALCVHPAEYLSQFEDDFDFILMDCPPSLGRKLTAALIATQYVVCPIKVSGYAIAGLEGLFNTIQAIRESINPEMQVVGAIVNEYDGGRSHKIALADIKEELPDLIFENMLRHRPPIDAAQMEGIPIWKVPHGRLAAIEFRQIVEELMQRVGVEIKK